jgi:hypothetical protein
MVTWNLNCNEYFFVVVNFKIVLIDVEGDNDKKEENSET